MAIDWTYWPSDPRWADNLDWGGPGWWRAPRASSVRWESLCTVPPIDEPVSVAVARNYSKIDVPDDDELIETILLPGARQKVEEETGRAFMTQTWVMYLDRWPSQYRLEYWPEPSPRLGDIMLPRWPVQSITSIVYTDSTGTPNTVPTTVYGFDGASKPARIYLNYGQSWPASAQLQFGPSIAITLVAGSLTKSAIDPRGPLAILRLFDHYYNNRSEVIVDQRIRAVEIPQGAQELIDLLTIGALVA